MAGGRPFVVQQAKSPVDLAHQNGFTNEEMASFTRHPQAAPTALKAYDAMQ